MPDDHFAHSRFYNALGSQQIAIKTAGLLLLGGFWFFATYINTSQIFSRYDLALIFGLIVLVVCVQGVVLAGCALLPAAVVNALAGAFAIINGYSTCLIFAPFISSLSTLWFVLLTAVAWWVSSVCFASLSVGGRWLKTAMGVLSLLFVGAAVGAITTSLKTQSSLVSVAAANPAMTSSPNVKIVDFVRKPNVYLLSFDAMVPESLAKEILGLPSLPYQTLLQQQGFVRLRNHFSDGPDTISSLNQFFALDPAYFHTLRAEDKFKGMVSGYVPSPLLEIFKANGYSTNFYHQGNYLGHRKGPHIDHYQVNFYRLSACSYLTSERHLRFGLLAYCQWQKLIQRLWLGYTPGSVLSDVDIMFDDVAARLGQGPALFYAHFLSPLHVAWDFTGRPEQLAAYQKTYAHNSMEAALAMERILAFLQEKDPGALVFIFSDHGLHTNRYRQWKNLSSQQQQREYILSYYGAFGAVSPTLCADYINPEVYSINSQIARDIIRCLAGGEDPFLQPPHYSLIKWRIGWGNDENGNYADYLYE